jgi:hypothetical protein
MKVLIVHLSDIHIRLPGENVVVDRATAISNAAHTAMPDAERVVFALTGDIAYAGKQEEYNLFGHFLSVVLKTYRTRNPAVLEVVIAAVPGNHDCRLDDDQSARSKVMDGLPRTDLRKSSIFESLVYPQRHFFEFLESGLDATVVHPGRDTYGACTIDDGDSSIDIICFNTALCTRHHEMPGTLLLPPLDHPSPILPSMQPSSTLILAHHPPHWLTPESYHELRSLVLARQAILLTGHEHQPSLWTAHANDRLAQLLEGGVLQQTGDANLSSFHTLSLDTTSSELQHRTFTWAQTVYVGTAPKQLAWAQPAVHSSAIKLNLQEQHLAYLEDTGNVLTHPRRDILRLSDVFIFPDLKSRPGALTKSRATTVIKANEVLDALLSTALSLVKGGARSGKTSLAKRLFYTLWSCGKLPLLLNGEHLKSNSITKLTQKIEDAIKTNYRVNHTDEFLASDHELILIIDDLSNNGASRKQHNALLGHLRGLFKHIIIFDRTGIDLDELVVGDSILSHLKDVSQYDLLPLGNAARQTLVEKWVLLGTTPADPEPEVQAQVVETAKLLETLLGRDYVPRTPFYVLSLLSAFQEAQQPSADLGSLGYLYDLLIRTSLAKAARRPEVMRTFDKFLSDLAFGMYKSKKLVITRDEFAARCEEYASRCLIDFADGMAEEVLKRAHILLFESGHVFFRYKYLYYFFVAKYLSQKLSTEAIQEEVRQLTQQLHRSESSNVLLFLCHCTSDPIIVESMVALAAKFFPDDAEADFDNDTAFLNQIMSTPPSLSLGKQDATENRKRMLADQDEEERASHLAGSAPVAAEVRISDDLAEPEPGDTRVSEFNKELMSAFKTIEIAGQILRNHPTVDGVDKIRLVKGCTSLVRRMLSSLLSEMSNTAPEVMAAIQKSVLERRPQLDPSKARAISNQVFQIGVESLVIGIIESYAANFGILGLSQVFKRIRREVPDSTMRVFDLAVKLENPREFPEADASEIERMFRDNPFVRDCVRALVFLYYYLFTPPDRTQKQRMCAKFGIDYQSPAILATDQKLLS